MSLSRVAFLIPVILFSQVVFASVSPTQAGEASSASFNIRELAGDGAWTWFNDERVIVDDNMLYIGCMDSRGYSRVYLYPLASSDVNLPQSKCILSSWRSRDDHNNPALLKMNNGKILAAYARHGWERRWYCRVADINDSGMFPQLAWGPEVTFRTQVNTTYNNLFQLPGENGRIYNFMRCIGYNPNILYSDDSAQTWTGPFVLIKSGGSDTRPYVKYASNNRDRIDFLYTDGHPRDIPDNSVYHFYYKDGGFYKTDGTLIKTLEQLKNNPIVPSDGTKIYDGSSDTGRGWVWDLDYDKQGDPVAAYISSADDAEGSDLRYRYAQWDSTEKRWTENQIAYAGTHLYVPENHYAGGIAIDPENTDTVYISCDVNPIDGKPSQTGHYQIFRGALQNDSNQWKWTQITFDTEADNIRPVVPRNHGCRVCVLWLRGQYTTYTSFATRIVGIIEK